MHRADWVASALTSLPRIAALSAPPVLSFLPAVAEELSKWNGELDAIFASATSKAESAKLTGAQAAAWDIASDKDWGQHLAVENQYIRSAIWASWKQALRKWQDAQKK